MTSNEHLSPEYRRYRRAVRHFAIRYRVLGEEGSEDAEVRDLSAGGVRIHTGKESPVGTRLSLDFRCPELGLNEAIRGEVVWTRRDADAESYNLGVRFVETDPFPAAKLFEKGAALPDEAPAAPEPVPPEERRVSPRVEEGCPIRYRPAPAGWFSSWFSSSAVNLSGSGVAFAVEEEPIKEKGFLELEIALPAPGGKIRARALVVRGGQLEEKHRVVGVHFVEMSEGHQRALAEYLADALQRGLETS